MSTFRSLFRLDVCRKDKCKSRSSIFTQVASSIPCVQGCITTFFVLVLVFFWHKRKQAPDNIAKEIIVTYRNYPIFGYGFSGSDDDARDPFRGFRLHNSCVRKCGTVISSMNHKETPRGWFFGLFYGWKHRVLIVLARCIDHNDDS